MPHAEQRAYLHVKIVFVSGLCLILRFAEMQQSALDDRCTGPRCDSMHPASPCRTIHLAVECTTVNRWPLTIGVSELISCARCTNAKSVASVGRAGNLIAGNAFKRNAFSAQRYGNVGILPVNCTLEQSWHRTHPRASDAFEPKWTVNSR